MEPKLATYKIRYDANETRLQKRHVSNRFLKLRLGHCLERIEIGYDINNDKEFAIITYRSGYPVKHWKGTLQEFDNIPDAQLMLLFSERPANEEREIGINFASQPWRKRRKVR